MKKAIQEKARELGFDACGFTSANPPEHAAHFQNWIAAKRHGEMGYLQRNADKRVEPQLVLEKAKTIIALAVSYADGANLAKVAQRVSPAREKGEAKALRGAGETHCATFIEAMSGKTEPHLQSADQLSGVIARYARYSDYHDVIGERLKLLTAFVNDFDRANTQSLWYVDTGPILERDFAQRAGIGFIGKHTNLISRELGNWIFLAEIITTLELETDAPEKNRCGSCTRCISACPTDAITAPFQLDARRCISYLTIELKGSIPIEFRRAIGNRIYGCDDCLAACPWNRFAQAGKMMKPFARPDLAAPDLIELLGLDDAEFRKRFSGTPILRAKRRGFLRNVCVALGNVGNVDALPALQKTSLDAEPLIAEHARWAIAEIELRAHHVAAES